MSWTGSALGDGATAANGYYVTRVKNSDSSTSNACGTKPIVSDVVDDFLRRHGRTGRHLPLQGHGGLSHVDGNEPSQRGRHDRGDAGPLRGDDARQDATAGTAFDVTVTAKSASNATPSPGTRARSTSRAPTPDLRPDLPSNYNFAAGDHGIAHVPPMASR